MRIKVIIISDNQLLLQLLIALIRSQHDRFELLAGVDKPDATLATVIRLQPDLLLYDVDGGADNLFQLLDKLPGVSLATRVLLLSLGGPNVVIDEAMRKGASGLIDRSASPELLLTALEKVHEGQLWLDRQSTARIFHQITRRQSQEEPDPNALRFASLTERERAIVQAVMEHSDAPRKVVAAKLHISESTLRNHLTSAYEKLGVKNRNGLLAFMFRLGHGKQGL